MDNLIKKIQDLEREARKLKKGDYRECFPSATQTLPRVKPDHPSPPRPSAARSLSFLGTWGYQSSPPPPYASKSKEPFEVDGDGDWYTAFKKEAGPWIGKKLVVLSLFDGIGGIWAALTRLGIPFVGYSSEVSAPAIEVVKAKFPEVHHVGDVRKLDRSAIREEVDLIIGGFPCQDLSCMGRKEGLHGPRSRLFFDLLKILKAFHPRWYLVENVASMTWIDREEISKHLGVQPLELDSVELTPSRRRRLYWTNIPHPLRLPRLRDHPSTFVQSCLHNAIALEEKTGVILGFIADTANSCTLEQVLEADTNELRKITQTEVEQMLGYLPNHTDVKVREAYNNYHARIKNEGPPKTGNGRGGYRGRGSIRTEPMKAAVRWMLLGNTFTVPSIAYLMSPLLRSSVRELGQPVYIPGPVLEKECSVMEADDVWALYNEHERPSWYALIMKISGDRFCHGRTEAGKKSPLCIEMQYLEIAPSYLDAEDDEWNPSRGTGLYEVRKDVDTQVSWTSFSHRVTSLIRMHNKVFIFPGKDEVWTVFSRHTWSPFFVYVIHSTINIDSLESATPGYEGFYAQCYLIIKTREHETYRRTEKVLEFTDLSVFCFRAPYIFKQEANILKVEVGTKGRKMRKIESMIRRRKRRRSSDSLSEEDEDVDDEGVDGEEAENIAEGEDMDGLTQKVEELIQEVEAKGEIEHELQLAENDDEADGPEDDEPDVDADEEGVAENGISAPQSSKLMM